jgi:hypothetical protein
MGNYCGVDGLLEIDDRSLFVSFAGHIRGSSCVQANGVEVFCFD